MSQASLDALAFHPPKADDWRAQSLCAETDPELFYPDKGKPTARAKAVCRSCPVKAACLEWALAVNEPHGVWGGKSTQERKKIRRERYAAAAAELAAGPATEAAA